MRRSFSIALLVLLLLGPLTALLPGMDESRLPACCRRHGAHHCAMAAEAAAPAPGEHSVGAPSQCPLFHISAPATLTAFLPAAVPAMRPFERDHEAAPSPSAVALDRSYAHSDRGPPSRAC